MQVFIINRNRLTTTRLLVEYMSTLPNAEPTIIDNDSTWEPLIDWYETECSVRVIRGEDFGPRALWSGHGNLITDSETYAVTDSDLDLSECPVDLLEFLSSALDKYPNVMKVGVSLRLDDIPDEYPLKKFTMGRESGYWEDERDEYFYNADVATTMAVYRPGSPAQYGPALRSKPPYQARHVPWYITSDTISAEEQYYIDHVDFERWKGIVFSRQCTLHLDELGGSDKFPHLT